MFLSFFVNVCFSLSFFNVCFLYLLSVCSLLLSIYVGRCFVLSVSLFVRNSKCLFFIIFVPGLSIFADLTVSRLRLSLSLYLLNIFPKNILGILSVLLISIRNILSITLMTIIDIFMKERHTNSLLLNLS